MEAQYADPLQGYADPLQGYPQRLASENDLRLEDILERSASLEELCSRSESLESSANAFKSAPSKRGGISSLFMKNLSSSSAAPASAYCAAEELDSAPRRRLSAPGARMKMCSRVTPTLTLCCGGSPPSCGEVHQLAKGQPAPPSAPSMRQQQLQPTITSTPQQQQQQQDVRPQDSAQ